MTHSAASLSKSAVLVLHVLRDSPRGEMAGAEIWDATGMQVGGLLLRLEQEGLVAGRLETDAERAGAKRRSYVYYSVTAKGLRLIEPMGLTTKWTTPSASCPDCGLSPDEHAVCPHCQGDFGRGVEQRDRHADTCSGRVRCPACGALAGQRCHVPPFTAPHIARENAARRSQLKIGVPDEDETTQEEA